MSQEGHVPRPDVPYQPQMYQPSQPFYPPPVQVNNVVNVNIQQKQTSMFIRVLYYLFIGWWAGYIWLNIGYLLCLTVLGLPLGLVMLNRLPTVLTLRPQSQNVSVQASRNSTTITIGGAQQLPFVARAAYFVFVGSWAGYLWASVGYLLCLLIVTIPVGLMMLNRLPAVITLRKN